MNDASPLTLEADKYRQTAWEPAAKMYKEERSMRSVTKIVVKGAVDVVFFRESSSQLVVASDEQSLIKNVITRFEGSKLVIEQEGVSISGGGRSINVSGNGNIIAGGNIYISGGRGKQTMRFPGSVGDFAIGQGRCLIGITMPEAPLIRVKSSGNVTLYDLDQPVLDVSVQGSGDITAFGRVELLDAEVAGSGDFDASELVSRAAKLSVAGSGDIDAFVTDNVKARVAGSGDIVVRGSPATRDHNVFGSGDIKFKKK